MPKVGLLGKGRSGQCSDVGVRMEMELAVAMEEAEARRSCRGGLRGLAQCLRGQLGHPAWSLPPRQVFQPLAIFDQVCSSSDGYATVSSNVISRNSPFHTPAISLALPGSPGSPRPQACAEVPGLAERGSTVALRVSTLSVVCYNMSQVNWGKRVCRVYFGRSGPVGVKDDCDQ